MKRSFWILLGALPVFAVLAAMGAAAFLLWGLPQAMGTVSIDGRILDPQGAHVGHWLLATMGVLLAMAIVLVVVPTVVLLVLTVPAALAAFGLGVAALACVVVLSPLWLSICWLWKNKPKPQTMTP